MSRVPIAADPNRIEFPTSPSIFIRGVVYAANSNASNLTKTTLSEEKITHAEDSSFHSSQDS